MKILFVSHKIITFILNEVVALNGQGHEVSILTPHNDKNVFKNIVDPFLKKSQLNQNIYFNYRLSGQLPRIKKLAQFFFALSRDFIKRPGVTFRYITLLTSNYTRIGAGIDDYFDFRELLDKRFDVLYSSFSTPSTIDQIYFLSKVLRVPFVLAFRAHDMYEGDNLSELIKRGKKISSASAFVTISKANEEYAQKHFLNDHEVHVIHSAVDVDFFTCEDQAPKVKHSIIAIARFHEQKGLIDLVRACHILANRNIPYHCTLIGRGGEEQKYRDEIAALNIPDIAIVNYLDREGVRVALSQASIFALPCIVAQNGLRDILPNALKEAMAMELPVITSDISGIQELVEDGRSGFLTPPGKPEALADALEKLLADEVMRKKMGKEGRLKVKNDFNITVESLKLERVFVDALSGKGEKESV